MNKQEQQNLYEQLVTSIISSDNSLKSQKPDFDFKSAEKLILKVKNKRSDFKSSLESQLSKNKGPYKSQVVSGSSFDATIVDFKKYFPTLKPLTIQYKESGAEGKPAKVKTAWQERGAAYIFQQALVNDVDYDDKFQKAKTKLKVQNLSKKFLPDSILLERSEEHTSELQSH